MRREATMNITIIDIAHHRNGVCGAPFAAVLFEDAGPEGSRKIGILFDEPYHCAVLDVAKLAAGDIAFGSNSFRGDHYEPRLRAAEADRLPVEPPETDIHELLAERRLIGLLWGVDDVQEVRPDLNDDQCWEVLQHVERRKDAEIGIDWLTLEMAAEHLFGNAPETNSKEA
jgi:hypothetical protein